MNRPSIGGAAACRFLSRPYVPNENARTSEIHGSTPDRIVIPVTPTTAMPTATCWTVLRCSLNTITPSATDTRGLMK
jgi:hypothetical protein